MYPCFELSTGKNNLFYWVLISSNGRTILKSIRGYKTKQNAQKSIDNVLCYGLLKSHYQIETANIKGNGLYYVLYGRKADNIIAMSGNGKFYHSQTVKNNPALSWQVCENGANKGVNSCITNLQKIAQKKRDNVKFIHDIVPDNRKIKE
jgi:uncharacterized protein YegP (UPF0339 family)